VCLCVCACVATFELLLLCACSYQNNLHVHLVRNHCMLHVHAVMRAMPWRTLGMLPSKTCSPDLWLLRMWVLQSASVHIPEAFCEFLIVQGVWSGKDVLAFFDLAAIWRWACESQVIWGVWSHTSVLWHECVCVCIMAWSVCVLWHECVCVLWHECVCLYYGMKCVCVLWHEVCVYYGMNVCVYYTVSSG